MADAKQDETPKPPGGRVTGGSYPALPGAPGVMLPTATVSVGGLGWLGPIHLGVRPRWYGRFTLGLAGLILTAIFFLPVMARGPDGVAAAPASMLFRWGIPYEVEYSAWLWVMALAPLIAGVLTGTSACLSHRLRGPFAAGAALAGLLLLLVPHAVLRAGKLGTDPTGRAALLVATTLTLLLLLIGLAALTASHTVARRRQTRATRRWPALIAAATLFVAMFLAILLLGGVRLSETFIAPETLRLKTPLPDADLVTRTCLVFSTVLFGASAVLAMVRGMRFQTPHRLNRTGQYCARAAALLAFLGYLFYFHSAKPAEAGLIDRLSGAGLFVHLALPYMICAAVLAEGLSVTALLADHEPAPEADAEQAAESGSL